MIFKSIVNFYQYLFYKFYSWHVFLHKGKYFPHNTAWMTISLIESFNFLNLLMMLQILTGYQFIKLFFSDSGVKTSSMIIIYLVFNFFDYFFLMKNKKYIKIVKRYEKEDRASRIKGNIFTWSVVFGTIFAEICLAILLRHR